MNTPLRQEGPASADRTARLLTSNSAHRLFGLLTILLTITKPSIMKLYSRLLSITIDIFPEKCQIWVSEPHFGGLWDNTGPWLMARWKGRCRRIIRNKSRGVYPYLATALLCHGQVWGRG